MSESNTVKLCDLDAVAPGEATKVELDGRNVLVARIGDSWYAIDDTCSHAKVSLSEGLIEEDDCAIECPRHGALFSLETGEAMTLPAIKPVAAFATDVKDDGVYVTLSKEDNE